MEIIAIPISSFRPDKFNAAHRARLAAKKEIESLPNADDQKLVEGRKTINKVSLRGFFE